MFVVENITMVMTNGITLQNMPSPSQFQISDSRIYPHGRNSDADGSGEARASILIADASGRIDDTLFLSDKDHEDPPIESTEY